MAVLLPEPHHTPVAILWRYSSRRLCPNVVRPQLSVRYIPHHKSSPERSLHDRQPLQTSGSKAEWFSALICVLVHNTTHLRPSLLRAPLRARHYPSRSRAYDSPQFQAVLLSMWWRVLHFFQVADRTSSAYVMLVSIELPMGLMLSADYVIE
jgi:hypothetical protein